MEEKNCLYKEEQMNGASREYRHDEGTGLIQGTEKAQQKLKKNNGKSVIRYIDGGRSARSC